MGLGCDILSANIGKRFQVAGRFACLGGGGEDGALVAFHDLQPMADVGCMIGAKDRGQPEFGAKEGRGQFGDEFFHGIGIIAEAFAEFAGEATLSTGPV